MNVTVTIGRAATYGGVTVKAIRHYHRLGLIAEPRRDSSGYRRYGSKELLRLVRIRTLANAGVRLTDVKPLLELDGEEFTTAVSDIRQGLTDRIETLLTHRDTLDRLADGDRALLPKRALAILDRMPDYGYTPDDITATQEGLILAQALDPSGFEKYITSVEHIAGDDRFIELDKQHRAAKDWPLDDLRIENLAQELADHILEDPAVLQVVTSFQAPTDAGMSYGLLSNHGTDDTPARAKLTTLIKAKLRHAGVPIPN